MRSVGVGIRALGTGGLGEPIDVGADTLAYAAKAGSKSYDGDGPNSPCATALLRHLAEPGADIRIALGRVRDDVLAMTGGRQEPFIYGSLGRSHHRARAVGCRGKNRTSAGTSAADSCGCEGNGPGVTGAVAAAGRSRGPIVGMRQGTSNVWNGCVRTLSRTKSRGSRRSLCANAPASTGPALRESVGGEPAVSPAARNSSRQQVDAGPPPAEACARDAERLQRLRDEPNPDEIRKLERELSCERIRPQVQRLCDSVCR
jgi:hypothetical protein